jgi:hypothetical protein
MDLLNDFTIKKYQQLCHALLKSNRKGITINSYFKKDYNDNDLFFLMRHDVDRKPDNALNMAEIEHNLSIQSTYYFRYPYTFDIDVIKKIYHLNHEVGYHYEVLSKARGDYHKALYLFAQEVSEMRKIGKINTICMHGTPLSKYNNKDFGTYIKYDKYEISGDALLSIKDLQYFSDTGRGWNSENNIRDYIPNNKKIRLLANTDDLIDYISTCSDPVIYINIHPNRWASTPTEWMFSYLEDFIFNVGKKVLMLRGK